MCWRRIAVEAEIRPVQAAREWVQSNPSEEPENGCTALRAGRIPAAAVLVSTLTMRDGLLLELFEGLVEGSGAQGFLRMISFQSRAASGRHRWTLGSCLRRASAF